MEHIRSIVDEKLKEHGRMLAQAKDAFLIEQFEKHGCGERIKALLDPDPDKRPRFSRILCERQGNIERYYYDDGTLGGKLVCWIEMIPPDFSNSVNELGRFEYTTKLEFHGT